MIKNLLEKITVVNCADRDRWNEIKTEAINTRYQIVWDASSGLDIYPMVAAKALGKVPDFLSKQLQNAILVMSDYDPDHLNSLKNVYQKLDHGPVRVWRGSADFVEGSPFYCNLDGDYRHFVGNSEAFIDQMIPLNLWGNNERNNFQKTYETRLLSSIHSVHDDLAVPDDDYHLVYFLFRLSVNSEQVSFPVVFIAAENLLIFEQIFQKYKIPIEIFFAVRVGGFSGNWDSTHDFRQGMLPCAIQKASPALRPRFWGVDQVDKRDLPKSFRKVGTIEGLGNGGCKIFKTNWRSLISKNLYT